MNDKRVERLWRNDGSCIRLRPECRHHVWSYDFGQCRTDDGRAFRMLNILDEHSRECLTIRVKRKLNSTDVIDALTDLFILRDEVFYSLREAQILIEELRKLYDTKRPHSALGYRPPTPETIVSINQRLVMH